MSSDIASAKNEPLIDEQQQRFVRATLNREHQLARLNQQQIEENKEIRRQAEIEQTERIKVEEEQKISEQYNQALKQSRFTQIKSKKKQVLGKATAPVRKVTNKLLMNYWQDFLPSWGATLLLIDLHVLGRFSLGTNFFCKLGHEWVGLAGSSSKNNSTGKTVEEFSSKLGIIEASLVVFLNLVAILLIIFVLSVIVMIVSVLFEPWRYIWPFIEWLYSEIF